MTIVAATAAKQVYTVPQNRATTMHDLTVTKGPVTVNLGRVDPLILG